MTTQWLLVCLYLCCWLIQRWVGLGVHACMCIYVCVRVYVRVCECVHARAHVIKGILLIHYKNKNTHLKRLNVCFSSLWSYLWSYPTMLWAEGREKKSADHQNHLKTWYETYIHLICIMYSAVHVTLFAFGRDFHNRCVLSFNVVSFEYIETSHIHSVFTAL